MALAGKRPLTNTPVTDEGITALLQFCAAGVHLRGQATFGLTSDAQQNFGLRPLLGLTSDAQQNFGLRPLLGSPRMRSRTSGSTTFGSGHFGLNHAPRIRSRIHLRTEVRAQATLGSTIHLEFAAEFHLSGPRPFTSSACGSSPSGLRPITSDAQREFTFEAQANQFVTLDYIKVSGSTFVRANVANSAVDCTKIASSTFDDTLREATPVDPS